MTSKPVERQFTTMDTMDTKDHKTISILVSTVSSVVTQRNELAKSCE
jgi:hypothetical protein